MNARAPLLRRCLLALGLAVGPVLATAARADTAASPAPIRPIAAADVSVGTGYDTNLFLQIAAVPDSPAYRPYSGWFARLAPAALLALSGDSARLELRYAADMRQTAGSGALFLHDAALGVVLSDLGPASLRVSATAGRFDATIDSNVRFLSGGAAAQLVLRLGDRLRAVADYRLAWRDFAVPARVCIDTDRTQTGELRLSYSPRPTLQVGVSGEVLDLRSNLHADALACPTDSPVAQLRRLHAGVDAGLVAGELSFYAAVWGGTQHSFSVIDDRQLGGSAVAQLRLSRWLDAVVRYDNFFDWRREGAAGYQASYQRQVVMLGLTGHAAILRGDAPAAPAESSQAPRVAAGGQVRFRVRAPGATSVEVIGSWNEWAPDGEGQRLSPTRDAALWEGSLRLPPGRHRYHFLVDGRAVRPADAPQYRQDDFGSEDGVLEVAP